MAYNHLVYCTSISYSTYYHASCSKDDMTVDCIPTSNVQFFLGWLIAVVKECINAQDFRRTILGAMSLFVYSYIP